MLPTLADAVSVQGTDLIHAIIWIVVAGLIFWLLWWLISYIAPPEPFAKVARVILALFAVLFLINVLLSVAGHPIVKWS